MSKIYYIADIKIDMSKYGINLGNITITEAQITAFIVTVVKLIGTLIAMYLVIKIGSSVIHKFMKSQSKSNSKFSLNERKARTLEAVLKSILRYSVYFVGVILLLTIIFGPISLTFAGIGGVAIGFGAQSLVKDIINGFFILFEDQYSVGDNINIDDKGGVVESIELRVTKIRDFNGDLHIIPNGLISKVTNHSRGNIRVSVDIEIPYEENVDRVMSIISKVCEEYKKENENMVEGPKVLGIGALKESSMTIKVIGKAKPMTQGDAEIELRGKIKRALDLEHIKAPYPRRQLVKEE